MPAPTESEPRDPGAAPHTGWGRVYALVAVCAVAMMVALYWFSSTYNVPLPRGR